MSIKHIAIISVTILSVFGKKEDDVRLFPDNFKFGVATSAYQVEGAWNVSGKGENIWDRYTHNSKNIADQSNGDIACDSYHNHKRDVEMLQELGVDFYRFSPSWSRILPDGITNKINDDGIRYYNVLINDLIAANITPYITLYHWDLPQPLQELGGWINPLIIGFFASYAEILFEKFGDRVKTWLTFNEPENICVDGYGTHIKAPGLDFSGIGDYMCTHTVIKAHAAIYHLYHEKFRPTQKGRIGLTVQSNWYEPKSKSHSDREAAERAMQFSLGWYYHPILSEKGDYPQVMKDKIAKKSLEQGFVRSRLPQFTVEEIEYIKGTSDFLGLNHYTTEIIASQSQHLILEDPSFYDDIDITNYVNPDWPSSASSWLKVVPWGFRKLLNWIKDEYHNPEVIVFENGFSNVNEIDDEGRINYYHQYLNALLDAIDDGCSVIEYSAWSLMDNFEWASGYTQKFGLYHVNFSDPMRTRTPKNSAFYFKNLIYTRTIKRNYNI